MLIPDADNFLSREETLEVGGEREKEKSVERTSRTSGDLSSGRSNLFFPTYSVYALILPDEKNLVQIIMFQRGRTRFISFLSHGTRPFLLLCLLSRSLSLSLFLRAFFRLVEIVAYTHTHTQRTHGGRRGDTRARN